MDDNREILDRTRRIETRVTKIGHALGLEMGSSKPTYKHGKLHVPSPNVTLAHCVAAIPADVVRTVPVLVGDDVIAHIARS